MTAKDRVLQAVAELPNESSMQDILDNLNYLNKIAKGAAQLDQGLGLSSAELKAKILNG
jgi:hypothetical protein